MAEYDAGHCRATQKHGCWVLEAEVWRASGDVAHLRIDLDKVWAMLARSETNVKGVCRRGPLQVRRPSWIRKRLC